MSYSDCATSGDQVYWVLIDLYNRGLVSPPQDLHPLVFQQILSDMWVQHAQQMAQTRTLSTVMSGCQTLNIAYDKATSDGLFTLSDTVRIAISFLRGRNSY